ARALHEPSRRTTYAPGMLADPRNSRGIKHHAGPAPQETRDIEEVRSERGGRLERGARRHGRQRTAALVHELRLEAAPHALARLHARPHPVDGRVEAAQAIDEPPLLRGRAAPYAPAREGL